MCSSAASVYVWHPSQTLVYAAAPTPSAFSSISESRLRASMCSSSTSILRRSSALLLSHIMCNVSPDCLHNECDQIGSSP
ncbi:hypothetical protein Taro_047632 [Colocasia esculenta]|uniref:Uncharacterized protein n=1 Tax=Colocasia esculenta TaxID=4460 RepID=A0A843WTF6_COLES|nr:hypothetical protein [Colocasia esculenta]